MKYTEPMLRDGALEGQTILVTGGGSGLGKSMSKYFLELGAKVVIFSRKQEKLDTAAQELQEATGGEVLAIAGDVRKYEDIEKLLATVKDKWGGISGLVNNAAGNFISPTERLSHRAFDTIVSIVLQGSYNCTLALGKEWIATKTPGTVLNIVTTYSWTGSAFVVPSAISKAGVLAMTRSLAVEWAKYKIRLNAVAPGPFPTQGAWERLFPENLREKFDIKKKVPVGRTGEHQELANLTAYLMSEYSAYVNGEVFTIDGGEWLKGAGEFNYLEMIPPEMWDQIERMVRGAK